MRLRAHSWSRPTLALLAMQKLTARAAARPREREHTLAAQRRVQHLVPTCVPGAGAAWDHGHSSTYRLQAERVLLDSSEPRCKLEGECAGRHVAEGSAWWCTLRGADGNSGDTRQRERIEIPSHGT